MSRVVKAFSFVSCFVQALTFRRFEIAQNAQHETGFEHFNSMSAQTVSKAAMGAGCCSFDAQHCTRVYTE
jgi:hypothetical protein